MMKMTIGMNTMKTTTIIRTYSELITLRTFDERYNYLKLDGAVGAITFGFDRYMNQRFYNSEEWKRIRREVMIRDNGCDLGVKGYDIISNVLIHHMNPIAIDDIVNSTEYLLDPEFLISTTLNTHNGIHYGKKLIPQPTMAIRYKNDTCPWKK